MEKRRLAGVAFALTNPGRRGTLDGMSAATDPLTGAFSFVSPAPAAADDEAMARERRGRRAQRGVQAAAGPSLAQALERPTLGVERYLEEQRAAAGSTIIGGRRGGGERYKSGPYRNMTPAQADEKIRADYAAMDDGRRQAYESGAQGADIASEREKQAMAGHYSALDQAAGVTGRGGRAGRGGGGAGGSGGFVEMPARRSDGGSGFTGTRGAGKANTFALRTPEQVSARIENSPASALTGGRPAGTVDVRRVSSERTSAPGMTSAMSADYKARALAAQGGGAARPAAVVAPSTNPPAQAAGKSLAMALEKPMRGGVRG